MAMVHRRESGEGMINYREIPCFEDVDMGAGSCGQEQGNEQTRSDQNQGQQYKNPEPVAYDPEVSPDPEVLLQDRPHIGLLQEGLGEVLDSEYLEVADEAVEHAHEEVDRGPVQPGDQLQGARDRVAEVDVAIVGDGGAPGDVPPQLVGCLEEEAGEDEAGPENHRTLQTWAEVSFEMFCKSTEFADLRVG